MAMEIFTSVGNLPRSECCSFVQSMEKKQSWALPLQVVVIRYLLLRE
jgi:hypothetical protein